MAPVPMPTTPAEGRPLALNTPTVFNASLNFRLNWEGNFRSLEDGAEHSSSQSRDHGVERGRGRRANCVPIPKW